METMVLIHGFGFDFRIWSPLEIAWDQFRVIQMRLPGFGNDKISGSYTIEELARDFWEELDSLGVQDIHLAGHSMGGYVCMEMIAQKPGQVRSLVLIHSHVFADNEEKKAARTKTVEEIKATGREGFVRKMISSLIPDKTRYASLIETLISRGMQYSDEAWYTGTEAMRDRRDHTETLKALHMPIQFIMGEKDMAVPVELAYKQSALAEESSLLIYPEVGHLSMYENTGQVIVDLLSFYSEFDLQSPGG